MWPKSTPNLFFFFNSISHKLWNDLITWEGASRNCLLMFQSPKIKIVKIVLKFCNKHQNMAKILPNFIPDQKMAHFFEKKSIFKGGQKDPPPCTSIVKSLGPIGLKSCKPPKMLILIEEGVDLSVHLMGSKPWTTHSR